MRGPLRVVAALLTMGAGGLLGGCAHPLPAASPPLPVGLKSPFTGFESVRYRAKGAWLCLPGREDACTASLDATELHADGSRTIVHEEPSPGADKVDCFYVYPTVDLSLGPANHDDFHDLAPMTRATVAQAARFRTACRLFVPLYRQGTIGVYLRSPETRDAYLAVAASDVVDAFVHYMANFNGGRKVVLIGHSQGAEMVTRLLQRLFDDDPLMRSRLLVALAIGGQLEVPAGATTGGSFWHIPICTQPGETSCVVGFRSYVAGTDKKPYDAPPRGHESVCVNPGELDRGAAGAYLRTYIPLDESRRRLRGVADVTTPWILLKDLYRGECMSGNDPSFRYLGVSFAPLAGDVRLSPIDMSAGLLHGRLGLHILDFQFPQGDLVDLVARRAAALP